MIILVNLIKSSILSLFPRNICVQAREVFSIHITVIIFFEVSELVCLWIRYINNNVDCPTTAVLRVFTRFYSHEPIYDAIPLAFTPTIITNVHSYGYIDSTMTTAAVWSRCSKEQFWFSIFKLRKTLFGHQFMFHTLYQISRNSPSSNTKLVVNIVLNRIIKLV